MHEINRHCEQCTAHYAELQLKYIHRNLNLCVDLLSSNVVWTCRYIPTFRKNIISTEEGGSTFLRNVGIYTALQSRRTTRISSPLSHVSKFKYMLSAKFFNIST
jgi:hypothetical protein